MSNSAGHFLVSTKSVYSMRGDVSLTPLMAFQKRVCENNKCTLHQTLSTINMDFTHEIDLVSNFSCCRLFTSIVKVF